MKLLTTRDGLPRLSWASIIAGVILSMIVYLIMSVLGTAIGASLLSPMSKPDPLHGFGFGSGVWVIVTTVLAVFVGSYYAGRCAPVLGWLHGLLSWAVMTLLIVYGMTSLITGAVSTAGSVAATTAQVGATAGNQAGTNTSMVDTAKQQVQAAVASAASAASGPQAEQTARETADKLLGAWRVRAGSPLPRLSWARSSQSSLAAPAFATSRRLKKAPVQKLALIRHRGATVQCQETVVHEGTVLWLATRIRETC